MHYAIPQEAHYAVPLSLRTTTHGLQDKENHLYTVVAAAITSRKAKNSLPTHILLENVPGLAPTSLLLLEQLRTIDRKRLRGYIGRISKEKMLEVDAALAISIGILGSKPYR